MKKYSAYLISLILFNCTAAQKEGIILQGDVKIHYRSFGSGKPVLIINGGPGMNSDGFSGLAAELSKNCNAITFDQRGTGQSLVNTPDSSTITMKKMAGDMEALRKHLKVDTWILLGHSFGGMLAAYYTSLYPDKVEALILSSSGGLDLDLLNYFPKALNAKLSVQQQDSISYWTARISAGDTSHSAKLRRGMFLAAAYVYDKKNIPVIAERLTQTNLQVNGLVWQNLQKINFDCKTALRSFTKPVLIIQGKQDLVDEKTALQAQTVFKNSQLFFMDSCVHYGWLDRPDQYYGQVGKFIRMH